MAANSLSRALTQFFPPKPQFTERNLSDLSGKVYIVTGASSGLGRELSRLLYSKNAKVYVTGRSEERANEAIKSIKTAVPESSGSLVFLGPEGPTVRTSHGYERHLQVNCLGPFLFFKLLAPVLVATAQDPATPPNTVCAVFLSSFAAEMFAEKDTGFKLDNLDYHVDKPSKYRYGISKLGDWAYAVELSKRYEGVIGLAVNPGNLRTDLFRDQGSIFKLLTHPLNYPAINGAYTQLWAGLSPDVKAENAGSYVAPFGRFYPVRNDLEAAAKPESEGGNGSTQKFWEWSEEQVKQYY